MNFRNNLPALLAEMTGTFFLVFFGCGMVIVSQLYTNSLAAVAIPLVFGGAVSIMIYTVGHISGAHFNPAVTLAFVVSRRLSLPKAFMYILFQCLGAVLASAIHMFIMGKAGHSFGVTHYQIAVHQAFVMELVLSFCLMFVIMAVATDTRAVGELAGIAIGSAVAICAFVGGPLTGASMNPARSLGPAFVSNDLSQIWLYVLAPLVGTVLAALFYNFIKCSPHSGSDCC